MRRIGVHTSIAGGIHIAVDRARELGCSTFQIFSHNPRSWHLSARPQEQIESFGNSLRAADIRPVFVHSSYLINLASRERHLAEKSAELVASELDIADTISADFVILHTGSASGEDPDEARKRASDALVKALAGRQWRAGLLLENTAGERGDITSSITDLSQIASLVPKGLIAGICLDTCHAFAAGYDLRSKEGIERLKKEIQHHMGMDAVKVLHVNDCKGEVGSGVDRHEHIGMGRIGLRGFELILKEYFTAMPVILETPKKTEQDDMRNLEAVRTICNAQ